MMANQHTNTSFRCGVIQLRSTEDTEKNLNRAEHWIRKAVGDGADMVALPENFSWLRCSATSLAPAQPLDGHIISRMQTLAASTRTHLLLGSFCEPSTTTGKTHNTSIWIDNTGGIIGIYRKIFLFDIDIPGTETQKESDTIQAGTQTTCVNTPWGTFGMSICYDLRFPELYRKLVNAGASYLCIPSAFTLTTGKDHWHVLLRARAIENQCYVIAPGQWGHHGGKRTSYGHSMIVDPWGTILAEVADGEGYAIARIDPARVKHVRKGLPCLEHQRPHIL